MKSAAKQVPELTERNKINFWKKVEKRSDGVWAWTGNKARHGYGIFAICIKERGRHVPFFAHRISWVIREREMGRDGIIPQGIFILHKNDVTEEICDVNPENLRLGTQRENIRDAENKGRMSRNGINKIHANPSVMQRGSERPNAKLNEAMVLEMKLASRTGESYASISRRYGINERNGARIIKGEAWAHVALPLE